METLFEEWELFKKSVSFDTAFFGYSPWTVTVKVSIQSSWNVPASLLNRHETHAKEGNMFFLRGNLMEGYGSSMEIHLLAGYI